MTRRTRGILIVLAILALLVGSEVVLNLIRGSQGLVQVKNLGNEPIENLVVGFGDRRFEVARIPAGSSSKVYITGSGTQTLRLTFRQRGNALSNFHLPDFNPEQMSREGFKLVLLFRPNEIERFQDDAEPYTVLGWFIYNTWGRIIKWVDEAMD
jgi:hypothetical protein